MFPRLFFAWGLGVAVCLSFLIWGFQAQAQDAIIQDSGGVSAMLIIGPIDPGRNTSPNGVCSDGGRFGDTDYLTNADGSVSETNILVEEGVEVTPDFGGMADARGVKRAQNRNINPGAADEILTVWLAQADFDGRINYNDFDKIGDPVDDYIVYSLIYLENTTARVPSGPGPRGA